MNSLIFNAEFFVGPKINQSSKEISMVLSHIVETTYNYVRVIVPLVGDPDNLPDVLEEIVDSP